MRISTVIALSAIGFASTAVGINVAPPPQKFGAGNQQRAGKGHTTPNVVLAAHDDMFESLSKENAIRYTQPLFPTVVAADAKSNKKREEKEGEEKEEDVSPLRLGDSPYMTARAALVEGFKTTAVTFDYSGSELSGMLIPPPNVSYRVGLLLRYPCIKEIPIPEGSFGNMLRVFLDDAVIAAVDLGSEESQRLCGSAVSVMVTDKLSGQHSIRVVKLTEPSCVREDNTHNNITFAGFNVVAPAVVQLAPLPPKKLRMEFVGDSITCGFHVLCKSEPNPDIQQYLIESVLEGYSGRTCTNLDAQCHYISWSGRGMAYNYYNSDDKVMSYLYNFTMATVIGNPTVDQYDFSFFTPHIIVINLGTNDFVNPSIHDEGHIERYIDTYAALMRQMFAHYGAGARIVTVCGPMAYTYCDPVQKAIALVSADAAVPPFFFRMANILTNKTTCADHPDAAISIPLAQQLTDFIQANVVPTIPNL